MAGDVLQGKWMQLKGSVKQKWGQLTDNDIAEINGNREKLEGKLREKYGYTTERAREEADKFFNEHAA